MTFNPRLNRMHPSNWKKDFYICLKLPDGDDDMGRPLPPYSEYESYIGNNGINYQPIKDKTDIEIFGENSTGVIKAVIKRGEVAYDLFTDDLIGSLVYLDGVRPDIKPKWALNDEESFIGEWANYQVNAVRTINLTKHIYFVKYKSTGS